MSSHRRVGRQVLLTALALVALVVTGVGFATAATPAQWVKLDTCENGRYYPGYDPQSIKPESRDALHIGGRPRIIRILYRPSA